MKLLLGTANPGKIQDYKKYLVHSNLEIVIPSDIRIWDEPLERGQTYEENALQKARFYAERTELATMSEDGGFEVDALDRRPGLESNRWLGPFASDEDKIAKIYELLHGVPTDKRTARLVNVAVVYFPDARDYVEVSGSIEGTIIDKPSETRMKGFPYRSVLYLPQFGKHYIDLSESEHEQVNHRKIVAKELLLKLEPYLNQ